MEQIASQIIGPVVNILTRHISKHIQHVTSSTKRVADMISKMEVLKGKSKDVSERMERNQRNRKEIPARVEGWLREVEDVNNEVQSISSDVNIGCLNIKKRYRSGRNAFKTIEEIERLINEEKEMSWSDAIIPLGRVDSKPSPSSEITQNDFKSRDKAFEDALKYLQQDDMNSQVIALCGMGGVGKTTMMEQLKKIAQDKQLFKWIAKSVVGQNPNMISVQNDIAAYLKDCDLPHGSKLIRAEHLTKTIAKLSQDNKKVLIILDDVWEKIELKDIGLTSPLPKGVKLLLTSRDRDICKQIAVYANLDLQVVKVDVLEEAEAHNFFSGITGVLEEHDPDKYHIGCGIVKKCGYLPLAIKLIASTLKSEEISVWRSRLNCLNNHDLDKNVQEIIKISYEYIEEDECKAIFLHCSLFPEDANIPIEELTRHAWGLKLLKNVSTLREARDKTKTCVQKLIHANLLINGDEVGCVKMHDLVLAFVVGRVSNGGPAWIIKHQDVSKWDTGIGELCKQVSLTCMGLSKFPGDFKYPNLSHLQLMHGSLPLEFPKDFYENMQNLKVIAYYELQYPLFPRALANLKSLCLQECKLMFDLTSIGDLENLEVLSLAHCGIHKLPATIGKLRKLKLLDLTGCVDLHIDDGVFKNLESLEELYMRVSQREGVRFTNANFEELKLLSSKLCALEVEFVEEKTQLKHLALTKLYKFKIAMGCLLEEARYNERNTLMLVTDSITDLQDCKINELLNKTENLYLQVGNMTGLQDVVSIHRYDQRSFCNLTDLVVFNCVNLIYLFPMSVASGLRKLERLRVSSCSVLKALVQDDGREINSQGEMIKFEKLKFLSLQNLPKLASLFLVDNVVDLPQLVELEVDALPNFTSIYPDDTSALQQPFLNSQVRISMLNKLKVKSMEKLTQIWACSSEEEVDNISMLREIEVEGCNSLVYLFPTNPMRILNHLERLTVKKCGSIETVFNYDLEWVGHEVEQVGKSRLTSIAVMGCDCLVNLFPTNPMRILNHLEMLAVENCGSIETIFNYDLDCVGHEVDQVVKSSLRSIMVKDSEKVRESWRIKGGENNSSSICGFEALERINIQGCKGFRNVFTTTNTKLDIRIVADISIYDCGERGKNKELINVISSEEIPEVVENMSNVAFPSSLIPAFSHGLSRLDLRRSERVKVVFEISNGESATTHDTQQQQLLLLFPYLKDLRLECMEMMTHVWKCDNWNKFLLLQKQPPQSSFHNLVIIKMWRCYKITYLFSPIMAKLFPNLEKIYISQCNGIEEVVSNRDDKSEEMTASTYTHTTTNFFPRLQSLEFYELKSLKHIGGVHDESKFSQVGVVSWSLCQYSKEIEIRSCEALSSVIPSYAVMQMQNLQVLEVFSCSSLTEVFETQVLKHNNGGGNTNTDGGNSGTNTTISRLENINVPQLSNLKKLVISSCYRLQFVFTYGTLESLKQLEELTIKYCEAMKVIVKEENEEQTRVVTFPHLKSLELVKLPDLEGFFMGKNDFQWPSLEKVKIGYCPKMTVFTSGQSTAKKLEYMNTSLGKHSLECGLNFEGTTTTTDQNWLASSESASLCSTSLEQLPWSFHNLIELHMESNYYVKSIIPSNKLLQLQKLKGIQLKTCKYVEEVFDEPQSDVEIPNLMHVELQNLKSLKYIWKSNHHVRTVLEFPNLTTMSIDECRSLEHVFTSSMDGSLQQLQHLHIHDCPKMEVIVKVEEEEIECDAELKEIVLPRLESLKLNKLNSLKGFCLGKDDFSLPSLHTLEITGCPKITVFSKGLVATPNLNIIDTTFGRCNLTEDINSFIKTKQDEGFSFSSGEYLFYYSEDESE